MIKVKQRFPFKSRQPFFDKERHGVKNNTVREINLNEDKFLELIQWMMNGYDLGDIQIEITNVEDPALSFGRDIQDISVYNNQMIITWKNLK